jgi:NAD(P)-binding Rossmann-like domain
MWTRLCILLVPLLSNALAFTSTSPRTTRSSQPSTRERPPTFQRVISVQSSVVSSSSDATEFEPLGLPARPGRPLKVAIAGGGVGGLTTALCLLKKGIDVTVYEKTAAFARFGGPIQFASNALSVLKAIDDTLFDRVMEKFTFTGTRTCGIKDGLRADGSFRMTDDSLDYLWNPEAPADWFVKFPLKVRCVVLMRRFDCLIGISTVCLFCVGMCRLVRTSIYWSD